MLAPIAKCSWLFKSCSAAIRRPRARVDTASAHHRHASARELRSTMQEQASPVLPLKGTAEQDNCAQRRVRPPCRQFRTLLDAWRASSFRKYMAGHAGLGPPDVQPLAELPDTVGDKNRDPNAQTNALSRPRAHQHQPIAGPFYAGMDVVPIVTGCGLCVGGPQLTNLVSECIANGMASLSAQVPMAVLPRDKICYRE